MPRGLFCGGVCLPSFVLGFLLFWFVLRTEEHYLHIQIQICSTSGGHLLFFGCTQLYGNGRAQTVLGTTPVFHHHINERTMSSFVLRNRTAFLSQVPEPQETVSVY